jgi:hypothetical protein
MSAIGDVSLVGVDHYGSDWVGIYLDGQKVYEGHPPEFDEALLKLGVDHVDLTVPSSSLADLSRMRGLPRELSAVRR